MESGMGKVIVSDERKVLEKWRRDVRESGVQRKREGRVS